MMSQSSFTTDSIEIRQKERSRMNKALDLASEAWVQIYFPVGAVLVKLEISPKLSLLVWKMSAIVSTGNTVKCKTYHKYKIFQ